MKVRALPPIVFAVSCLALLAAPSTFAQVVYDNGPANGNVSSWEINGAPSITDSFTISGGPKTVGGLSFEAWLSPDDTLESAEVIFSSIPFGGQIYYDQQISFTQSNCQMNGHGFQVCLETGMLTGTLPVLNDGTYWLTIDEAVSNHQDEAVYWDENSGVGCSSPGCPSQAFLGAGTIPSEAFTLVGAPGSGTVPEPSSLLLFGSGLASLVGISRRKR